MCALSCRARGCAPIPAQRLGLNPDDPACLAVRVNVRVARMETGTPQFLALIGRCDGVVCSQVVPKCQVPFDMRRIMRKAMQLGHSCARLIVSREITASRDAQFSPTAIAQPLQDSRRIVNEGHIGSHRHEIKNWLCCEAGNSSGTNVVDSIQHGTKRIGEPFNLSSGTVWPIFRVGNDLNSDWRRHEVGRGSRADLTTNSRPGIRPGRRRGRVLRGG